ncbi:hypothetical protein [Paenibacillus sp. Y412MC10]|uniref:hypothetical protein n=1 Tax=Geobacillus sp. (strain Y412MC10) TaxID=481743 RepID=UPI0011A38FDE|nr:hypothetical protein [Paenibacillus sp. Y412MC10]
MKRSTAWFALSFVFIFFSAPMGYFFFRNIFFHNMNLTGEYETLLYCTLLSPLLIGVLMFLVGLAELKQNG